MFPTFSKGSQLHLVLLLDLQFYLISDLLCDNADIDRVRFDSFFVF